MYLNTYLNTTVFKYCAALGSNGQTIRPDKPVLWVALCNTIIVSTKVFSVCTDLKS